MKLIKSGNVYDTSYDKTWRVCDLETRLTTVNFEAAYVHASLYRMKVDESERHGELFIMETVGTDYAYDRSKVRIIPVTESQAAKLAEDFLDYEAYVKFFGDPRGAEAENEEARKKAEETAARVQKDADYWYKKATETEAELTQIRSTLEDLRKKYSQCCDE